MYNGNYKVASLVYIYNVCSKTIFSPVIVTRYIDGILMVLGVLKFILLSSIDK